MGEEATETVSGIGTRQEVPTGIKLLCVFGTPVFLWVSMLGAQFINAGGQQTLLGIVFLVSALLHLVAYYGLWTVKSWGWTTGLVAYGTSIVWAVVTGNLLAITFQSLVFIYLMTKRRVYRAT